MAGINLETLLIIELAILAVIACFMFWWTILRPLDDYLALEHVIADFRREISRWEHEQ